MLFLALWFALIQSVHATYSAIQETTNIESICDCSSGMIPVPVDVEIPVDPTQGLNTTSLRRLHRVFSIFGEFCQPGTPSSNAEHVQLLLHGSTYTHQYWTFPMNGFQNYSYVAHACRQGQSTFSYDQLGVGLSERPVHSADIQIPTAAQIASLLAKGLKEGVITSLLGRGEQRFSKVIAIGHSQGSVVFNYVAITQPSLSGIAAMVLTGHIHDTGFLVSSSSSTPLPARDVDPARWGNLEPGYISTPDRSRFYSPDNSTFSSDVLMLDGLTKDTSTAWFTRDLPAVYVPAQGFTAPVVEMVGAMDQLHCFNTTTGVERCIEPALQVSEAPFWPDSRNFTTIVRAGSGHDLNLDFGASDTFQLLSTLVEELA